MPSKGYNLYRSLVEKQVIIPHLQNSFKDLSNWPSPELLQIADPRRHDSKTDTYFHPSIHADACALSCYLQLEPESRAALPPEQPTFTSIFTPTMGTVIHTIVQQKLIVDGFVDPADVEVALVNEERHWRGHADLIFNGKLVDIKTTRAEKFKFMKSPLPYWKYQMHPYMDELGLDESTILVIEMGYPFGMKEYTIKKDPALLDEIYTKWELVQESIKTQTPPSHEGCENRYCLVRKLESGDL